MIRALLVGCARVIFNLATVSLLLALLLFYGAYRLVRSAWAKDPGRPVRDAGFTTLVAVVALVKAIAEQAERAAPPENPSNLTS